MPTTRRGFLKTCLGAGLALPASRLAWAEPPSGRPPAIGRPIFPDPVRGWHGDSSLAAALRAGQRFALPPDLPGVQALATPPPDPLERLARRFADLPRHFIFEYYPWYSGPPDYAHWEQWDRRPPHDIAAMSVPRLGPYDSRSPALLERHARWIAEAGAGAINVSWWGRGSYEDAAVPLLMDVMRDHEIKVTFHLEPYADDHGRRFPADVLYLLREYGEKRGWDALLILKNADGSEGPVFKGFRTIVPRESTDCHGVTRPVPDYTADDEWSRQNDGLRHALRNDFDHVTILADTLDFVRARSAGFDGVAIYDNFVRPSTYAGYAAGATSSGLVFSFNVNPGYDAIEPRRIEPGSCYAPTPFEPPTSPLDWTRAEDREKAAALSRERILESFRATLAVQTDPGLLDAQRGFFLVYLTTFNEWHEGHAFEPMKDHADLTPEERTFTYHNPARGDYRLATLRSILRDALSPPAESDLRLSA